MVRGKLRSKTSSKRLTRDDVMNYKVDWSEWHSIVQESLHAFDFDGVAYAAKKLNIICSGWGEDKCSVKGYDLSMEAEHVCRVLIAMYELGWDEPNDANGITIYDDYCHAYKSTLPTDGIYHAYIKLNAVSDENDLDRPIWVNEPWIEIKLAMDENAKPYFQIDFTLISQSF